MAINISELIDVISKAVTIITLPVAVFTIWYNGRMAQKAIDLQIVANFSKQFHENWTTKWRSITEAGVRLDEIEIEELKYDYFDMLNWIDWIGTLIEQKSFSDPKIMLKSISPILKKVIILSSRTLNSEGKQEWSGVFSVARWLGLVDRNGKILEELD